MCVYVMRFIVPCKGNPNSHMVVPRDDYVIVISGCRRLYSYLTACSVINSLLLQKQKMESHSSLDESQFVPVKEDYFSVPPSYNGESSYSFAVSEGSTVSHVRVEMAHIREDPI